MKISISVIMIAGVKQRQFCCILSLILFILLPGCGGGGGVYYPPETAINTIDLRKIELSQVEISSYQRQFFPVAYDDRHLWDKAIEDGKKTLGTSSGYFQKVNFLGVEYYLHSNYYFKGVDLIRKNDMKKILHLSVPRNIYAFSAFEITMGNRVFLVVYVQQQPTSHSSTLFVIDSQFNIVYQEHLLGALENGHANSLKYGNCIVLKSDNFWFPNGTDKPRVEINGDWLYYLPEEHNKVKTTTD